MDATTVAVDLAKSVFELALANAQWRITARHRLTRTRLALLGTGCAAAWPPGDDHPTVRPYVRRNKTDRADAEAILEAVRSGQMPSVPVKRVEQQALVAMHRVREQWMTTRTSRINTLRGILREQGILLPAGARAALQAVPRIVDKAQATIPMYLRQILASVHEEVRAIEARIADLERDCTSSLRQIPS